MAYTQRSVDVTSVTREDTVGRLDTPRPTVARHTRRGSPSIVSSADGARVGVSKYSRASTGKSRGTSRAALAHATLTPTRAENSLPVHLGNRRQHQ